jgi:hypothetical protein
MPLTLEEFVGPGAGVLASAFDRFPFGIGVFSAVRDDSGEIADFACVYVNAGLERVTGLAANRFVGHRLLEVVPAFREGGEFDAYRRALEEGVPWDTEIGFDDDVSATPVSGRFAMRALAFGDGLLCTYEDWGGVARLSTRIAARSSATSRGRPSTDAGCSTACATTPGSAAESRRAGPWTSTSC